MKQIMRNKIASILTLVMVFSFFPGATQATEPIHSILTELSHLPEFKDSSGNWQVMEIVAYGQKEQLTNTKTFLENAKKVAKSDPSKTLSTDFETTAMALTSMGYNAKSFDVGEGQGVDLINIISNYNKDEEVPCLGTIFGYMYALMAYDSGDYKLPENAYWTREVIIDYLIHTAQHNDGGWAFDMDIESLSEPDTTAMVISALTPYITDENVYAAIEKGLTFLSDGYQKNGGYISWGSVNSNSAAMVIVALSGLGIDAGTDERFVKDDISLVDHLLTFKADDKGFGYDDTTYNEFATEQVFRALVAYSNFLDLKAPYNIYLFGERDSLTSSSTGVLGFIKKAIESIRMMIDYMKTQVTP